MNASGKFTNDWRVAIGADVVSDEGRAGNFERSQDRSSRRRAGTQDENKEGK